MKDKEKTQLILNSLKTNYSIYGRDRSWIMFPELRLGSGYCGVAQRRIDLFVINSSAGNETIAFEIKVSKQDFKHDIENDLKQRGARLYSNYFYYVTPKGLLKQEDIPVWAGLWELDLSNEQDITYGYFKETVPAPLHAKAMPSWGLICSMVRHINKDIHTDRIKELQKENRHLQNELENAEGLLYKIAMKDYDQKLLDLALLEYKQKAKFHKG